MPSRIQRSDFLQTLQGTTIDVRTAEADARLKAALPANADLDRDGAIKGEAELSRLFTQIDSFGRSPESASVPLVGPDGSGTPAARAMRALGELTRNREVLGWTEGIDLEPKVDLAAFVPPPGSRSNGDTLVGAAAMMIRERKDNYGTHQPWFNLDPNHALPANVSLGGLGKTDRNPNGVWKCNLFGGNAMYAGGFEPPYYQNRGKGEYPNANQFYKFSDKYAAQFGNKVHFKLVDEVHLDGMDPAAKEARLIEVLRSVKPGDLLMVDHMGAAITDGGHTRVVMANGLREDGSGEISSAQATQSEGAIRAEGLSSFSGEEHVWVLRPNRPRADAKPTPGTAPAPAPAPGGSYTVKPGDTYSKIAQAVLGSSARWRELAAANPGVEARALKVGMKLNLPG
jgi:LysM repeat protein